MSISLNAGLLEMEKDTAEQLKKLPSSAELRKILFLQDGRVYSHVEMLRIALDIISSFKGNI